MSNKWGSLLSIAMTLTCVYVAHAADCQSPESNQAVIFQKSKAGGACRVLDVGDYPDPASFSPVPHNAVSSLIVGSDVRVVLYQYENFRVRQTHWERGFLYSKIGNFDDRTSSIQVYYRSGGPAATWNLGNY